MTYQRRFETSEGGYVDPDHLSEPVLQLLAQRERAKKDASGREVPEAGYDELARIGTELRDRYDLVVID